MDIIIKYAILISCSFYAFLKLLHLRICVRNCFQYIAFLSVILLVVYYLRMYIISVSIIFWVMSLVFFNAKFLKVHLKKALTTTIISIGFSYLAFFIAAIPSTFIVYIILGKPGSMYTNNIISLVLICLIQFALVIMIFRIKRLKNGMPFLIEHGSSELGVYISFTLILAATFLGMNKDTELLYIIPLYFAVISGLIVLFWWRKSLSNTYIEKIKAQEIQALQDAIILKGSEIEKLKQHNEELSKIIHKDNKLIPALEYAVRQYLLTAESETDQSALLAKGTMLLTHIENVSKERSGIIKSYESNNQSLVQTGVASVDSLLMYMLQRSREHQIDFNLSLSGSVKYLVENIISEQELNTLLADLIENAIIATKKCMQKNILVHIGIIDNCYSVEIFDNGIPFQTETLSDIGLKPTTTHAGEGGSGIGLMTTFDILKRYGASFSIDTIAANALYTKKVSVCFDRLGQYRIKSDCLENTDCSPEHENSVFMRDIGA